MNRCARLCAVLLYCTVVLHAQDGIDLVVRNFAVEAQAVVLEGPTRLAIQWLDWGNDATFDIYRMPLGGTDWGSPETTVNGNASGMGSQVLEWIDTDVSSGQAYEYHIVEHADHTGDGYLFAGIEYPAIHQRGTVLLILDNRFTTDLAPEIARLKTDFIGDGWRVHTVEVAPTLSVPEIKGIVEDACTQDPSINRLMLFGNLAVPYSGLIAPDGHGDHYGAWPADVYYGVFGDVWTDETANHPDEGSRNENIPGDGKFDQSEIPGPVEVAVGRVDLTGMGQFMTFTGGKFITEPDLMRRYLDKDHEYRHGGRIYTRRGLVDNNFDAYGSEAFGANAWRNFSSIMGMGRTRELDWFTTLDTADYLMAYGCGPGSGGAAGGVGSTADFASTPTNAVFTFLFGSGFGDWDHDNNFLKAPLASRNSALVDCWVGRPAWNLHHMALGLDIGHSTLLAQNNEGLYLGNSNRHQVHIALMGDPTLRTNVVLPADSLVAAAGTGDVLLTWAASADTVLGYHVYRSGHLDSAMTLLTTAPLTATTFTDTAPLSGANVYMVRAAKLETSGGGTYVNLSQGIFDSASTTSAVATAATTANRPLRVAYHPDGRFLRVDLGTGWQGTVRVALVDLKGALVTQVSQKPAVHAAPIRLNTANIANGSYLLRLHDTHRETVRKVTLH